MCPQVFMGWEMLYPCTRHPAALPSVQPLAVCFLCRTRENMRCPSRCGQRGAGRCSHPSRAPPCPPALGTGWEHLSQGDSSQALGRTHLGTGHPPRHSQSTWTPVGSARAPLSPSPPHWAHGRLSQWGSLDPILPPRPLSQRGSLDPILPFGLHPCPQSPAGGKQQPP